MLTVGQRIEQARKEAGLSRAALARQLNRWPGLETIVDETIKNWEQGGSNGNSTPRLDGVYAISRELGLELSYFTDGIVVPEAPPGAPSRGGTTRAPRPAPSRKRSPGARS